jgi:cytochrome P450 family 110
VLAPTKIRDFEIPKGALVTVAMHLLHRRPEIFAEPDRFVPERFQGAKFGPYEYAPFGGGDRRCLGMAIAIHEVKTIVATMLSRVDLVSVLPTVRPVRRGAFLGPEDGLPVDVRRIPQR